MSTVRIEAVAGVTVGAFVLAFGIWRIFRGGDR